MASVAIETEPSYAECETDIAEQLAKDEQFRDMSRLRKLFRKTHLERQKLIAANQDGAVKLLEQFPLLSNLKFVRIEFKLMFPDDKFNNNYDTLMKSFSKMGIPGADNMDSLDEQDIWTSVQNRIASKTKRTMTNVILFVQAHDVSDHIKQSNLECPPRLVIVVHEYGIDEASLLAYGKVMPNSGESMCFHLKNLIAAYYAYDINYTKQYQLLGLIQTELVLDHQNTFFQCTQFLKFMKQLTNA